MHTPKYPRLAALAALLLGSLSGLNAADVPYSNSTLTTNSTITPFPTWSAGANWVGGTPPANGDNAIFPAAPAEPITANSTTTYSIDTSPTLSTFSRTAPVIPLNFIIEAGQTLSLANGITTQSNTNLGWAGGGNRTAVAGLTFGLTTINGAAASGNLTAGRIVLTGDNTWTVGEARTGNTTPDVGFNGGLIVNANISGSFNITKVSAGGGLRQGGSLQLGGDNSGFNGSFTLASGTVQVNASTNPNFSLGNGTFTFAPTFDIPLTATLALSAPTSRVLSNNIINNNPLAITATEYSQISHFGGTTGYRTTTFNGTFSTGPSYVWNSSLLLNAGGTGTFANEGTLVFNGSWASYSGGNNTQAIRIQDGTFLFNTQASVPASGGFIILGGSAQMSPKLVFGSPSTIGNPSAGLNLNLGYDPTITAGNFSGGNVAGGGGVPNIGVIHTTGSSTISGALAIGTPGTTNVRSFPAVNIFSLNSGVALTITGRISGGNTGNVTWPTGGTISTWNRRLHINDSYSTTVSDTVNSVMSPVGTVILSTAGQTARVTANATAEPPILDVPETRTSFLGGVEVVRGTLVVNNAILNGPTQGSATGAGSVVVGRAVTATTGISGNTTINSRAITTVSSALAANLRYGQPISGTNIPVGAVITNISLGNGVNNSTLVISANSTATGAVTDLSGGNYTTTATLGGTGIGYIAGNTTINAGSTLSPGMAVGAVGTLNFGNNLNLTATSNTILDVNGTSADLSYDTIKINNGNNTITQNGNLTIAFGVQLGAGNNTLTLIDGGTKVNAFAAVNVTGAYGSVALTNSAGTWIGSVGQGTFSYVANSGNLTVTEAAAGPAAPTGLSATTGDASVSLAWIAPAGTVTSYTIQRSTTSGSGYTDISTGSVTGTTYTDSTAVNGSTYFYVVAAVNAGGTGANSNEASATPQVPAPAAPTSLGATAGDASVSLVWTAPSGTVSSYTIRRSTSSGSGYSNISAGSVTGTTYTDSTAVNGTTYFYVVAAVNAGGTGSNSNEVSATPVTANLFAAWKAAKFTTLEQANAAISGNTADPDADGLSNLLEYATGTEPKTANPSPVTVAPVSGVLNLTFPRIVDAKLTYAIKGTDNLVTGFTAPAAATYDGLTAGSTTYVDTGFPLATTPRRFLRLEVTLAP